VLAGLVQPEDKLNMSNLNINNKKITLLFMKELNKFFNQDNKTMLLGLLSILIVLWTILYVIPGFLVSLFNTILGNLILLLSLILVSSQDVKYGIAMAIILVIFYRFSHLKEGFTWSEESGKQFIELQNSINPRIVFDLKEIQKQASQEEVDYFLKNSKWSWSKETEDLYNELLNKNTYVRLNPDDAINNSKTKYNETIITQILNEQLDVLQNNSNKRTTLDDRDGLGSYAFSSGLEPQ
jgi:hypothetical protein